jgi:hypothetical protein
MYLVTSDPADFEHNWKDLAGLLTTPTNARTYANKLAGHGCRIHIYKLETIIMPIGDTPVQAYKMKDNGDILPCD